MACIFAGSFELHLKVCAEPMMNAQERNSFDKLLLTARIRISAGVVAGD
jgi:hypothetical protein